MIKESSYVWNKRMQVTDKEIISFFHDIADNDLKKTIIGSFAQKKIIMTVRII